MRGPCAWAPLPPDLQLGLREDPRVEAKRSNFVLVADFAHADLHLNRDRSRLGQPTSEPDQGWKKNTLHAWRQRGWVSFRRPPGLRTPCVCWADPEELDRLRRLVRAPKGWWEPAPLPQ